MTADTDALHDRIVALTADLAALLYESIRLRHRELTRLRDTSANLAELRALAKAAKAAEDPLYAWDHDPAYVAFREATTPDRILVLLGGEAGNRPPPPPPPDRG